MSLSIWFRRLIGLLISIPLIVIGILSYQPLHGFHAEVILSGSMRPRLDVGSLIITRELPPWRYAVGDIVSFRPPNPHLKSVTHRIISLSHPKGTPIMLTKGDANSSSDPWITSVGAITGKEIFSIPKVGYGALWLQTPVGFVIVVLVSFFLCVLPETLYAWRQLWPGD